MKIIEYEVQMTQTAEGDYHVAAFSYPDGRKTHDRMFGQQFMFRYRDAYFYASGLEMALRRVASEDCKITLFHLDKHVNMFPRP